MDLSDIIVLAKQGYKPADIKELIKMSEASQQSAQDQTDQGQSEGANSKDGADETIALDANEKKTETPTGTQSEDINYKELYEKSQAELSKAQEFNTRQTLTQPGTKTDEEIFQRLSDHSCNGGKN